MNLSKFETLPDESLLWIYASSEPLPRDVQSGIVSSLAVFFKTWTSHGRVVSGAADFYLDRFLVVAAYIPQGDISGCGIDASVHAIDSAARNHSVTWLPPLNIYYLDNDTVRIASRPEFRSMVREGRATRDTRAVDTTIRSLGELRRKGLIVKAGDAWHARIFKIDGSDVAVQ